jgi:O-antigen/teichoic acid export membrane protein
VGTRATRVVRLGVALVFGVLALCCTGFGLFIAAKATEDNADSPDSTYLLLGGIVLVMAVCLAFASWGLMRGGRAHVLPWLVVCCLVVTMLFVLTTSPLFLLALVLFVPLAALVFLVTPGAEV